MRRLTPGVTLHNQTVVRISEPPGHLELEARAGELGAGRIAIGIRPWGDGSMVTVDEHPISGPGARWHNSAVDMVMMLRNRRMLDRLADVVQDNHAGEQ